MIGQKDPVSCLYTVQSQKSNFEFDCAVIDRSLLVLIDSFYWFAPGMISRNLFRFKKIHLGRHIVYSIWQNMGIFAARDVVNCFGC